MRYLGVVLVVVLTAGLAGCVAEETQSTSWEVGHYPIINGEPTPDPFYDATVGLNFRYDLRYLNFCSGTLITPTVVLTAAHCLDSDTNDNAVVPMTANEIVIYVGEDPPRWNKSTYYDVVELLVHPDYDKVNLVNDIGLLRLAAPLAGVTPVPPLPPSLGFTRDDEGIVLDFAGFGRDEDGKYDTRLHFFGVLDHIESATEIYYLQGGGGPCSGDSGGPAFLNRGATTYVGGITSYGDYFCDSYGVSTRVDAFSNFISAFAGSTGGCDRPSDCPGFGDDCLNVTCTAGVCGSAEVADDTTCGTGGICCAGECTLADCYDASECASGTCPSEVCDNAGTCAASCEVVWPGCADADGCCPDGCTNANDNDCPASSCGDGVCDPGEDCHSCSDCAIQDHPRQGLRRCCGDGIPQPKDSLDICDGNI